MDLSDEEILALLATDLNQYYVLLLKKYQKMLYTYVYRQVGNPNDAEDILQDTFLRIYTAFDGYSAEKIHRMREWLRPWLYKITRSAYLTYTNRYKQQEHASFDTLEEEILDSIEDMQAAQPERLLENLESRRELEGLVATLPEKYREVICLRYFDEFRPHEIADILRERDVTIRQRERRALALLRKAIDREKDEV